MLDALSENLFNLAHEPICTGAIHAA